MFREPVLVFRLPVQRIIFAATSGRSAVCLPRSTEQRLPSAALSERFPTLEIRLPIAEPRYAPLPGTALSDRRRCDDAHRDALAG